MRKLNYLIAGLFMAAAIVSCDKEMIDDSQLMDKKSTGTIVATSPESDAGVTPYLIPGANRGGNRTCEEVAKAFNTSFDYSSGKIDYEDGEFEGEFPVGFVTVDGKYVSFDIPGGCLLIDGTYYKVGAVIVKGGPQANVYYYGEEGASQDAGLASPVNASGGPAGLSNLTFCFVECEEEPEELVIGMKFWFYSPSGVFQGFNNGFPVGIFDLFSPGDYCNNMGINYYSGGDLNFDLHVDSRRGLIIGNVNIVEGTDKITVTVNLSPVYDYLLSQVRFYLGDLDVLVNMLSGNCGNYSGPFWNHYEDINAKSFVFEIPY